MLGIVALTVYALLRRFRPAPESIDVPEQQRVQNAYDAGNPDRQTGDTIADYLLVPSVIMRLLFPVIGTMAVFLFMRGHDLPGGGFVAGLTMALAIILQYMAGGATWVESRLRIYPVRWMAAGLLFAAATGVGAWLVGYPFLTSHMFVIALPVIGDVHVSSVLLFDLGVFSVVVGATVLLLIALAHQSLRAHRRPEASRQCYSRGRVMEIILALGIGVLTSSGVWLLLRPRTFQVLVGLSLLSYAVNLFIFSMGRLRTNAPPLLRPGEPNRPCAVHRSGAPGPGSNCHRYYLRDDRPAVGGPAGISRFHGNRSCRRPEPGP